MVTRNWDTDIEVDFAALSGLTITAIDGADHGSGRIEIATAEGRTFVMLHESDCCESVEVEDVIGDISDLIGHGPVTMAEVVTSDENPRSGDTTARSLGLTADESFTWTFYKLGTRRGVVTIRWYGTSNGYYSESVSVFERGAA